MITVKSPYKYVSAPGILKDTGEYIKEVGNSALIIGSKTALSVAGSTVFYSLAQHEISYHVKEFKGYPTYAAIDEFSVLANELNADVIMGIGGGKVMDVAKAVGQKTGKPVITVPTIAATCAAWAACSIIYDEQGSFAGVISLENSPHIVLLDLAVLANAPVRYLKAGIADTIAKWYETSPNLEKVDELHLRLEIKTAELALEIIRSKAQKVIEELKSHVVTKDFADVVDSVVFLAGLVGSINAQNFYGGFAHPFYNSITRIPETRSRLHGEKVSFGLLTQAVIENKSKTEILEIVSFLQALDQPVTLWQLGIKENVQEKVAVIANGVVGNLNFYKAPDHTLTQEEIETAILRADEIGREKSLE